MLGELDRRTKRASTLSLAPFKGFAQKPARPDAKELARFARQGGPDLSDLRAVIPSAFSDGAFKTFRRNNVISKDEDDLLAIVMPTILGPSTAAHPSGRNTAFGNLEPLTDGTIAPAKPDVYYGSLPDQLSQSVRDSIGRHIIPTSMHDKPLVPNFFVKVKGPDGTPAVVSRQVRYDGAVGSRGMHSLQNYGREEPQYDGQAYVFSSTYHNDTLKLYAHHTTAPKVAGMSPAYHMAEIKGYYMTTDRDTFVQGATAFRNTRDLARSYRHDFIQAANSRASQHATAAPQGDLVAAQLDSDDQESTDRLEYSPPRTPDEPAPGVTDINDHTQGSVLPELGGTTNSLTSNSTGDRLKRPRQPPSPDAKVTTRSPPSKSRHSWGPGRTSQSSRVSCLDAGEGKLLWVETYFSEGHICFRTEEEEEIKTNWNEWALQTRQDGVICFCWHGPNGRTAWTKVLRAGN